MQQKTLFASACLLATPLLLSAAVLYVSPTAKSGGDGSQTRPFHRIQTALDHARPGDNVQLAAGVYRERVRFVHGGEKGRPIRLNGPREAVIDAAENIALQWRPAPEIGPLVYRAAVPQQMTTIACAEGLIIPLNEPRVTPGSPKASPSVNDRKGFRWVWDWRHNFRNGIGEYGWKAVKALTMYREANGEMLIAFGDGRDPRKSSIHVSPREAAVSIDGVNHCTVSGLTIRHAWFGVRLANTTGSIVENCRIERSDFGVRMETKARECTVRFCNISMDPYCASNPWAKGSWDTWQAHKIGGFWDRIGIDIHHTAGAHKIHDNYIHNHWGGIQDTGEPGENSNLDVYYNRIHDIADDGLEPDGAEEHCRWHDNLVSDSRCGFRIKCVRRGPLYAYGNLFLHNREDFRNFGTPNLAKATVYVYFNTCTAPVGIVNNKVPKGIGTPNYHYFNNIFYCLSPFGETAGAAKPDWQENGNVFIRRGDDSRWETALAEVAQRHFGNNSRYLTGIQPGFRNYTEGDLSLTADSPARHAGIVLDIYRLPGLERYQSTSKPDAGALPFGMPMPHPPRIQEPIPGK